MQVTVLTGRILWRRVEALGVRQSLLRSVGVGQL